MLRPNDSFKPTPLRYAKHMAGTACHVLCSTTRRGLTQVLGGMDSDAAIVMRLERELLEPATRADVERVCALLTEDFLEVGASGLVFGKAEVLSWLPSEPGKSFSVSSMQAAVLGEGVMLVTYQAEKVHGGQFTRSIRSSVWVKSQQGWQMRFHQGTAAA